MPTWQVTFQHSFSANSDTIVAPYGSLPIQNDLSGTADSYWTNQQSNTPYSISGGLLSINNGYGNPENANLLLYKNPNAVFRDVNFLVRVGAGQWGTNSRAFAIRVGNPLVDYLSVLLSTSSGNVSFQAMPLYYNDKWTGITQQSLPESSPSYALNGSHCYDIQIISTGSCPMQLTVSLFDQGAAPPTFGTNLSSPTYSYTFIQPFISSADSMAGPGYVGFATAGGSGTVTYSDVQISQNVALQSAVPSICFNTVSGIGWSGLSFGGSFTFGGTGNYVYYWHRATTIDFGGAGPTPSTRVSSSLKSPSWVDFGIQPGLSYYYCLEVFDGVTSAYGYPFGAQNFSQSLPVVALQSATGFRLGLVSHSYGLGMGASVPSAGTQSGTDFAPVAIQCLNSDALGVGALPVSSFVNASYSGSRLYEWMDGRWLQRSAIQRFISAGTDSVVVLLTTNDTQPQWTTARVTAAWQRLVDILANLPQMKALVLVAAPPTPNAAIVSIARARQFALALKNVAVRAPIFIAGLEVLATWEALISSPNCGFYSGSSWSYSSTSGNILSSPDASYGGKAPIGGSPFGPDQVHPNDWGHFMLGMSVAAALVQSREQIYSEEGDKTHTIP